MQSLQPCPADTWLLKNNTRYCKPGPADSLLLHNHIGQIETSFHLTIIALSEHL